MDDREKEIKIRIVNLRKKFLEKALQLVDKRVKMSAKEREKAGNEVRYMQFMLRTMMDVLKRKN